MVTLLGALISSGETPSVLTLSAMLLGVSMVLGLEPQEIQCSTLALRLDFAHPPLFLSGLVFAQCILAIAEFLEMSHALQACLALLPCLWCRFYPAYIAWPGGPHWLPGCRQLAALIPVWHQLCMTMSVSSEEIQIASILGCFAIMVIAGTYIHCTQKALVRAREAAAQESGVGKFFRALGDKATLICVGCDDADPLAIESSILTSLDVSAGAPALANALEAFESRVRIERLDQKFLMHRRQWLRDLHDGYKSFTCIASSARQLLVSLRTPPNGALVIATLKETCKSARRVPRPLWVLIMEFVGGVQPLTDLMYPILTHYRGGGPRQQFKRAKINMGWCVDAMTKVVQDQRFEMSAHVNAAIADWWQRVVVECYGRGCKCGRSCKPADYYRCNFPFNVILPCCPRTYRHCCKGCQNGRGGTHGRHSSSCQSRYSREGLVQIYRIGDDPVFLDDIDPASATMFSSLGPKNKAPGPFGDSALFPDDRVRGDDNPSPLQAPTYHERACTPISCDSMNKAAVLGGVGRIASEVGEGPLASPFMASSRQPLLPVITMSVPVVPDSQSLGTPPVDPGDPNYESPDDPAIVASIGDLQPTSPKYSSYDVQAPATAPHADAMPAEKSTETVDSFEIDACRVAH